MSRAGKLWITVAGGVVGIAVLWVLAVLVLPAEGWLGAGQVTAFGLLVVAGLVIYFIALDDRDWKQMAMDRIRRRRNRRRPKR